jgi:molybdopterin-guanine dinucleotide biosynthesis protein A
MNKLSSITGIILVGGKSRRMGMDKAFLEIEGAPLFERVLSAMKENFTSILLVGSRPERFAGYALAPHPDIYREAPWEVSIPASLSRRQI